MIDRESSGRRRRSHDRRRPRRDRSRLDRRGRPAGRAISYVAFRAVGRFEAGDPDSDVTVDDENEPVRIDWTSGVDRDARLVAATGASTSGTTAGYQLAVDEGVVVDAAGAVPVRGDGSPLVIGALDPGRRGFSGAIDAVTAAATGEGDGGAAAVGPPPGATVVGDGPRRLQSRGAS